MADLGDRKGGRLETGEGHTHDIQHCITVIPWLYVLQRTSDNYKLYYKWWLKEGEDMIYKDVFFVINFYEN